MRRWLIAILVSLATTFNVGSSHIKEDSRLLPEKVLSVLEWNSLNYTGKSYLEQEFDLITDNIPNKFPVQIDGFKRISDYYGIREEHPIWKTRRFHNGMDMSGRRGTPILAAASGKVEKVAYSVSYGKYIIIDHENGIKTIYAHLSKCTVKKGQKVHALDNIAELGSTGHSTGPHLHFEVRVFGKAIDPLKLLDIRDKSESYIVELYQKVNKNEKSRKVSRNKYT